MKEIKYLDLLVNVISDWSVKTVEFLPSLISGIIVFFLIFFTSKLLSKVAVKLFQKVFPEGRNQDTVFALIGLFRFLIILSGAFISLEIMGLNGFFMKFLGSLGVAGIIAGVALKDLVSSIFSGLLVGIDKSFKVGDSVMIKDISGTVEEIGFLTTKIINDEGKKVYIPNQLIFDSPFINISESAHRKVIIDMEIPTSENLEMAKKSLMEVVQNLPYNENADTTEIVFVKQQLGFYNLQIKFWLKKNDNISRAKSDAIVKMKTKLDEIGIRTNSVVKN
ncbi:MAG: mechanosensitive ion channel [Bacteroidetes bacterium]|nr:mechanosensitive ion channel [Bacteroidota bacterium]